MAVLGTEEGGCCGEVAVVGRYRGVNDNKL